MVRFTPNNVISWALAFVAAWFGLHELFQPGDWVVFAPAFLGQGSFAIALVIVHGIILTTCAFFLVLNYYRRVAGIVLVLVFIEIITGLIFASGFSDIAVRDIGLLGMALAISISGQKS
jgi:hypothetical protein